MPEQDMDELPTEAPKIDPYLRKRVMELLEEADDDCHNPDLSQSEINYAQGRYRAFEAVLLLPAKIQDEINSEIQRKLSGDTQPLTK